MVTAHCSVQTPRNRRARAMRRRDAIRALVAAAFAIRFRRDARGARLEVFSEVISVSYRTKFGFIPRAPV